MASEGGGGQEEAAKYIHDGGSIDIGIATLVFYVGICQLGGQNGVVVLDVYGIDYSRDADVLIGHVDGYQLFPTHLQGTIGQDFRNGCRDISGEGAVARAVSGIGDLVGGGPGGRYAVQHVLAGNGTGNGGGSGSQGTNMGNATAIIFYGGIGFLENDLDGISLIAGTDILEQRVLTVVGLVDSPGIGGGCLIEIDRTCGQRTLDVG